ncbi:MAG: VanZ family protein [Muribaculaceae bacterium]|nr:VanZ family protein [Muribaculaceae bacterium]
MSYLCLKHIPRWLATVLVTAAILYATLASNPVGADHLPLFPGIDKVVHFIMFAALTAALLFDLSRMKKAVRARQRFGVSGTAAVVFGAVDELLQQFLTSDRSGDILDWAADCGGTAAVLIIYSAWLRQHQRGAHRPACRD